ncbi:hypothetical protein BB28_14640 [Mycobacteroides chelonae CCUG 47445]|nr:hypothetical protein BB28_14640 [Mycobacteroides chelonae CCUG 47445]
MCHTTRNGNDLTSDANILAAQLNYLTEPQTAPRRNQHQRFEFRFYLACDDGHLSDVGHHGFARAFGGGCAVDHARVAF